MTNKEALTKSLRMWEFLRSHPEATKETAYRVLDMEKDLFLCPLCQQARVGDSPNPDCDTCLLAGFWPDKIECMNRASPYYHWTTAQNDISRIFFAHLIVLALKEKLKEVLK